ncbi:hypothetical protein Tco_0023026, partial [Tanacetum coccineum]
MVIGATASAPLGLGYGALRHRELAVKEDQVYNTFEIGQSSRSVPKPERPERVSILRQPTLTTWIDPHDGIAYINIPAYPPPAPPTQTPPSPEWSSGSLPVSPTPSAIPSPISSPMISLTIPSPIASLVATPTATIPVDEDQFIDIGAQSLELEQERTAVTFGALWRPVLALEAWVALQRKLQEMRGRVTTLEQERDRRER